MQRLFLAGISLFLTACGRSPEPFHLPPDMTFQDLITGQPVDPGPLRGGLLLLNFWAAWSPASLKEFPELAALEKKFASRGLVMMGVCLDDAPPGELLLFAERQGVRYPLVRPGEKLLDEIQPLETIPYTILIDNDGKIVARFRGPFHARELRAAIEKKL